MRILHVGDDFAALRPCGLTLYSDALMRAQAAAGHDVSYVFSGRSYPGLTRPRLKRWHSGEIAMYELVGSPNHTQWETGTRDPLLDLEETAGETTLLATLREQRPELVHIHELARLPSSLIDRARAAGVPVVMTLHDYKPLCPTVRLLDKQGTRCLRRDVGRDCAHNCADAPAGRRDLVDWTLRYEMRRMKHAVPLAGRIDFSAAGPLVRGATQLLERAPVDRTAAFSAGAAHAASPEDYQRRRDVNVERLGSCDRLIAPSERVAEIYAELGVQARVTVQRLTLPHLEGLRPTRADDVSAPLTFATLGGCKSQAKGSRVVVNAVHKLERGGYAGRYRLVIHGSVEPSVAAELAYASSVTLTGPYQPAQLSRLLDAADVGILPSVWEETHGFVGIEMLAKGLPVIGSARGGIPEYVRPGATGWLNHSATGAELAEIMMGAIDDPSEVERMRRSVRALREELVRPMGEHVAEVQALYAEVTSESVASRSRAVAGRVA